MSRVDGAKRVAVAVLGPVWRVVRRSPFGPAATRLAARTSRRLEVTHPVTTDLRAWCADRAVPITVVSEAEEHPRIPPVALGGPCANFDDHRTARVPERFLVELRNARVWGDLGLVVLSDGTVAAESLYGPSHLPDDPAFRRPLPLHAPTVTGDVLLLSGEYSNTNNWFHWIHEGMLRLHGVLEHLPADTRVLVPADLQPWKAESLRLAGIPEERLLRYRGRDGATFERLWYPSLPPTKAHHPDAVDWLRRRLLDAAEVAPARPHRRLFLSRADAGHARIVNEVDLLPVLAERGFEPILPATMSVVDQIRTFAGASHVVGPTGAGFTNLLFADPGTRVLEILEPGWASEKAFVLWMWAETLGQPFSYHLARTVPDPTNPERADLTVDPEAFADVLDRWLALPPGAA